MPKQYKVNFHFTKEVNDILKNIMIKEYVYLRGKAIEILNDQYDKWNAEYGDVKITDDNIGDYSAFICRKQKPILDMVNKAYGNECLLVELDNNKDALGDIMARSKFDKDLIVHATLQPMEEGA